MLGFLHVFLSHGFRPFFLFAGIYAVVVVGAWLAVLHRMYDGGGVSDFPHGTIAPHLWHGHEMLFGYAGAAIAGFFLTAVPNWTGREPVRGLPLGMLALAWLAGRAALWSSAVLPPPLVAALDLVFVPALAFLVVRALSGGWSRRNAIFLPVFAALFAGNLLFHLDAAGVVSGLGTRGLLLALDSVLFLLTVIGGRVVPAFTTNALRRTGDERLPVSRPPIEAAAILSVAALAVADLFVPEGYTVGSIAAAAAIVHALRLSGWRGHRTLGDPLLWVLHLGYAWLVAGFGLKALAAFSGSIPATAALHALTIGAVGSMTLGVMTRAALGHTGRALKASPPIVAAYILVSAAALARVLGPSLWPGVHAWIGAAAILWIAAFVLFTAIYAPILVRPRERIAD